MDRWLCPASLIKNVKPGYCNVCLFECNLAKTYSEKVLVKYINMWIFPYNNFVIPV